MRGIICALVCVACSVAFAGDYRPRAATACRSNYCAPAQQHAPAHHAPAQQSYIGASLRAPVTEEISAREFLKLLREYAQAQVDVEAIRLGQSAGSSASLTAPPAANDYEEKVRGHIKKSCLSCHNGAESPRLSVNREVLLDFSDWNVVRANACTIVQEVDFGDMPKGGSLPDEAVFQFKAWERSLRRPGGTK